MNKLAPVFLTLTLSMPVDALVFGETNLPLFGYEDHSCYLNNNKPYQPYQFNSQYEIDTYNMEVDSYNLDLNQYRRCINEYIEGANNDIKRIKEKVNAAIDEFNANT